MTTTTHPEGQRGTLSIIAWSDVRPSVITGQEPGVITRHRGDNLIDVLLDNGQRWPMMSTWRFTPDPREVLT